MKPWGTVPTIHISIHHRVHYNSVKRADDPGNVPYYYFTIGNKVKDTFANEAAVDLAAKRE